MKDLNEYLQDYAIYLFKNNDSEKEFLDFLDLKNMITYITNHDLMNKDNIGFINDLLDSFFRLNAQDFNEYIKKKMEYFYTEIYIEDHEIKEMIVDFSNQVMNKN